jgi:hypothetical protein
VNCIRFSITLQGVLAGVPVGECAVRCAHKLQFLSSVCGPALTGDAEKNVLVPRFFSPKRRMGRLPSALAKLTLAATNENGKKTYLFNGKVDFFGEEKLAHSDGAGGPVCTILPQAKFFVDLAA